MIGDVIEPLGKVLFDELVRLGVLPWMPRWGWTEWQKKGELGAAATVVADQVLAGLREDPTALLDLRAPERAVIDAQDIQALEAAVHCVDEMYVPALNKMIEAARALPESKED